ncbi:MAG: aspartate--tRNA ligase, partial [Aquificota bacterium]|nr:aspartate--tRNA ligase [Aquificota bacterium]
LFRELLGVELSTPFDRISYGEAISRYGTDKPDRRFGLELVDLTDVFEETEFRVFRTAVESGGRVKAINFKGGNLSRKEIDDLTLFVQGIGAKGLAWIKLENGRINSPITKFLKKGEMDRVLDRMGADTGDVILFSAGPEEEVHRILGALRTHIAEKYNLADRSKWDILWVVDFPLMEWDEEEGRFVSMHHPFTAPREEDEEKIVEALKADSLEERKGILRSVRARAYDLVINGEEVGGGSIRIHRRDLQEMIFRLLGIDKEEAREKFGFLLEALRFGAPPHGGFAFGLDRMVALMRGLDSIRDVIAFPKTQKGICMLTTAPDRVTEEQLREVHIKVTG